MAKNAWIALITLAWAVGPACLADDYQPDSGNAADATSGVTTIDALLPARHADSRFAGIALGNRPNAIDVPGIAIDLEDNSMFGRLRRTRSIHFRTLSNQRRSRLFLGINERGYFGLHFTGTSNRD